MRIREITAVAAAIPLCLAELQHPLGYQYSETLPPHRESPFNDAFNQRVEQILEHFHIPGLAISVVNNGTTFAKGYGLSNIATSTPVTPETLFFAGSTTKAHTAAALSLLVDDNDNYPHIQWDTPVHTILPEFALSDPLYTSQITLTDMLSHRSGLPRHDMLMMLNTTAQDIVARLQHLPLTAPIRTKFQYCNLLYITAAHLIETVTGSSFEEFLQTNIWHPLGMTDTGFDLQAALDRNLDVAQGYYYDTDTDTDTDTATEDDTEKRKGNLYPTNRTYNPAITGAGNILTSATSYAKWMRALLTRRSPPLSHAGYEALFSAHTIGTRVTTAPFSAPDLYGLGWVIQNYRGETILQHGGAQDGYGALVVLLPGSGFGVAMLGNYMEGMNGAAQVLGFELVDNLLGVEEGRRFDWVGTYVFSPVPLSTTYLVEGLGGVVMLIKWHAESTTKFVNSNSQMRHSTNYTLICHPSQSSFRLRWTAPPTPVDTHTQPIQP